MDHYDDLYQKEFNKQANSFFKHPIRWIFGAALLIGFVSLGLSLIGGVFSTASTVASAPGRVIQKTLETNNIIQSYEWYYDTNAAYDARLGQVRQFKNLFSTETDKEEKTRIRIEMAAMQQTCRSLAAKYNANSRKMNKSIFKGWDLPELLNINNCE